MYFKEGPDPGLRFTKTHRAALMAVALLIVALGIHPDWLLNLMNL